MQQTAAVRCWAVQCWAVQAMLICTLVATAPPHATSSTSWHLPVTPPQKLLRNPTPSTCLQLLAPQTPPRSPINPRTGPLYSHSTCPSLPPPPPSLPVPPGVTAPHPNAGCLLFSPSGQLVGSGCQRAQGSTPSEVLAAAAAREAARGSTAYINLETGDCHGDEAAVSALLQAGVSRVVVGLRHPLPHLRCVLTRTCVLCWRRCFIGVEAMYNNETSIVLQQSEGIVRLCCRTQVVPGWMGRVDGEVKGGGAVAILCTATVTL
jgi:hypothetical protein